MKYAHLEKDTNKLLGWYDDLIHQKIPTPNIKVSEDIYKEALNINANCYKDDKFIVKDFKTDNEIETQRILSIKLKAGEIITSKYPIVWQLNHPRFNEAYNLDYEWIDNIRVISKKAEINGTALDDIDWGI